MQTKPQILTVTSLWLSGCSLVYPAADHHERRPHDAGQETVRDGLPDDTHDDNAHPADGNGPPADAGPLSHTGKDKPPPLDAGALDAAPGDDASTDAGHDAAPPDAAPDGNAVSMMCDGVPTGWSGCRGGGCSVCSELLVDYPLYLTNHPDCTANEGCGGEYYACSDRCPAPSEADQAPRMCDGTPGEWDGCRGWGCWVCAEKVAGYTRYTKNHPHCEINTTCDGVFFTCNSDCPAPTEADR